MGCCVSALEPTANVLALVSAERRRLDDLRAMDSAHTRGLIVLRAEEGAKALQNLEQILGLRAEYEDKLRKEVAAAAAAQTQALAAALHPLQKDVTELRQVQFQQQGERSRETTMRTEFRSWISIVLGAAAVVAGYLFKGHSW